MLIANNDSQPPKPQAGGGESFFARQRRVKGQQSAALAGKVAGQGEQTSMPAPQSVPGNPNISKAVSGQMSDSASGEMATSATPQGQPSTPVTGNGKIPEPQSVTLGNPNAPQPIPVGGNIPFDGPQGLPPIGNPSGNIPFDGPHPLPTPVGGPMTLNTAGGALPAGFTDLGNNLVRLPNGQTVDRNHPLFIQAMQAAGPQPGPMSVDPAGGIGASNGMPVRPAGTNLQSADLGNAAFSAYKPSTFTTQTPQGYSGTNISQWQAPDQSRLENGTADLASAILGNPESMSPDVVNALKNGNKEAALLIAKQDAMRNSAGAAARGMSGGGGESANERRIYDTADSNILSGNRNIDTTAASTNFNNRLSSLSAVDQILNSQTGRASTGFANTLAGQTAQAGDAKSVADSRLNTANFARQGEQTQADENYRGSESARQAQLDDLQRKLSQFGIQQAVTGNAQDNYKTDSTNYFAGRDANRSDTALAQQDKYAGLDAARADKSLSLQDYLGKAGVGIDQARLSETGREFDAGNALDIQRFLESQRQADNSLGYNYSSLNANNQNATIDAILKMINGGG